MIRSIVTYHTKRILLHSYAGRNLILFISSFAEMAIRFGT